MSIAGLKRYPHIKELFQQIAEERQNERKKQNSAQEKGEQGDHFTIVKLIMITSLHIHLSDEPWGNNVKVVTLQYSFDTLPIHL